jgi:hypothetical protein
MNDATIGQPPADLRRAIAANLSPVRPLAPPWKRALVLAPFAAVLLVAAPLIFQFRDLDALGWLLSWGASFVQAAAGVGLVAAALRESIPGRNWSTRTLVLLAAGVLALVTAVTVASWHASPVTLVRGWLTVGLICFAASVASALPATIVTAWLALRALPTRPAVAGLLAGLGGGLMADAGWRLFCHYSDPPHVLATHLGGVLCAGLVGAALTRTLARLNAACAGSC